MKLLNARSLGRTLDAVSEAIFYDRSIPGAEAHRVAAWIAGRRGLQGSYAGMFAPTAQDYAEGIRLFTGERISSGAATGHILGEEACRALIQLGSTARGAAEALTEATRSMDERLESSEADARRRGFF
jgi:hypothetical protein